MATAYTAEVREKASRLAELSGVPTAVLVGDVWVPDQGRDGHYCHRSDGTFSDHMQWAECPTCGLGDLVMFGWVSLLSCGCIDDRNDTGPPQIATPRLMKAYNRHGQSDLGCTNDGEPPGQRGSCA